MRSTPTHRSAPAHSAARRPGDTRSEAITKFMGHLSAVTIANYQDEGNARTRVMNLVMYSAGVTTAAQPTTQR